MTTQFANLQQAADTLIATVTSENEVLDGALVFITHVPDLIKSAVEDALAKGAPPSTLSAFATLNDVILQKRDAFATAIATTKTGEPASNTPPSDSGGTATASPADAGEPTDGTSTPE